MPCIDMIYCSCATCADGIIRPQVTHMWYGRELAIDLAGP